MASGLPTISNAAGGPQELIVDRKTGFLVSDEVEFAKRMALLAEDPSLRQSLGSAGRVRATAEFTLERMVDRTHAVYASALNGANATGGVISQEQRAARRA